MRTIRIPILAIMALLTLVGNVGVVTVQQQAYAAKTCRGCGEFKKLTGEFVQNIIKTIADPNLGPQPHLSEFRQLTAQFERDVINAVLTGDPGLIPGIVINWHQEASRIFLGGPDTIPELFQEYEQVVLIKFVNSI